MKCCFFSTRKRSSEVKNYSNVALYFGRGHWTSYQNWPTRTFEPWSTRPPGWLFYIGHGIAYPVGSVESESQLRIRAMYNYRLTILSGRKRSRWLLTYVSKSWDDPPYVVSRESILNSAKALRVSGEGSWFGTCRIPVFTLQLRGWWRCEIYDQIHPGSQFP